MKKAVVIIIGAAVVLIAIIIGIKRKGTGAGEIRIAVIPKSTASAFWEIVREGAMAAGAEEKVKILWNGPEVETDRERQKQIVEDFLVQKVSGLVLAPNDRNALVPSVENIYSKNIPCVIIDSGIETDKYVSFLATDNYKGGVIAAKRLGEILGGKGKVILVEWIPNSASTMDRAKGFSDTLTSEFKEMEIVDKKYPNPPTVEQALSICEDMLQKNPGIDGLFACNRDTAIGAMRALQKQQLSGKIKMVGFDSDPSLINGLNDGTIDSLVVQNPYKMGYEGVKTVMAKIRDKDVPRKIDTGVALIKKEDLEKPETKALLNLK